MAIRGRNFLCGLRPEIESVLMMGYAFSRSRICAEIVMGQLGGFFCKVESGAEISPEKLDFAIQVALQDTLSVLVRKLAMNVNGRFAGDRGHIPGHLAALLETAHGTVEHD